MNLQETFSITLPQPDFRQYFLPCNPPLQELRLSLDAHYGPHGRASIRMPVDGDGTLLLRYKGQEGAALSIAELENGEEWSIRQVQGAKSGVSYRVSSGIVWHQALADRLRVFALHPDATVQRLTMPPWHHITNITESASFEAARKRYAMVAQRLGLRHSEQEGKSVLDLQRRERQRVVGALLMTALQ